MFDFSTFYHESHELCSRFDVPTSKDFRVFVNNIEVPVYTCRISKYPLNTWWPGHQRDFSQSEQASFVNLISDEGIEIAVEPLTKTTFERVMIKPYAKGVSHRVENGKIYFSLEENGGFVLELDDYHGLLYIFNGKPVLCESPETVTHYFGKGVHFPGKITLRSGESVYLEKDALVYGCIFADGAENIRIYGNGIFDDSGEERTSEHCYEPYTNGNLKLYDCKDVSIKGVGFMNSAIWCINLFHCDSADLDGVNVFGQWRYNTDGIDIVNCKNVAIRNSFIHSFDDTVTIKGIDRYAYESNKNILVENCVLWCDWGRAMEIGLETECYEYDNITFRGCAVLRGGAFACDVQNGDCAKVHGITFENISLEIESFYTKYQLQSDDSQSYQNQGIVEISTLFNITNARFRTQYDFLNLGCGNQADFGKPSFASVSGVTIKDVFVYCDESIIAEHGAKCIKLNITNTISTTEYKDITVENIYLNGKKLLHKDMDIAVSGCCSSVLTVK